MWSYGDSSKRSGFTHEEAVTAAVAAQHGPLVEQMLGPWR